jgi:hypothetical protein
MTEVEAVSELVAKLNQIAPLATKVAELKSSTIDQETEALTAIMERIKPLLAIASHKIKTGYNTSGHQSSSEHDHYHDQKGGWQLILFADGTFGTLERSGDWSRWQGESSGWGISEEETLTPGEAIRRYSLKDIMHGLASELEEAKERLTGKKASFEERFVTIARIKEVMQ